ncbi:glyoxylate/hydroxypyruvate reductase A [Rhodobacter sp. 24-YEA-8]|uniref:2-hydroxyacid dehydrogenase n=1 Tax=Rhodobacter sp. 24-YEA-8 TaxID=1884310 RepID=UPI00089A1A30|nr:glyoxylate/hydroxypyruvate reductase A [Rhodobacter sp. 24-YEA-8]SEC25595.1 glyoxylate/hydroxypyruvate reductase A [Rhodobacter sp. 24-YEA-8]
MTQIFFSAPGWDEYEPFLPAALEAAGISADIVTEAPAPAAIDYILYAPTSPLQDFAPFTRAKAVMSLWAGVERIVGNQSLTQPLTRMVDPGLTESMVEYVTGHVLRHHLGMDRHIINPGHIWDHACPPIARQRPVTFLGLGELGLACARALQALNFPVKGWSRSPKSIPGLATFHGEAGLQEALRDAQIVITLLPNTPDTQNILNADTLAMTAPGAVVINPGRGPLIDDAALIAALDGGQISHATLDVFRIEPLPQDHPFWAHPKVTITPHVAADTRAVTASQVIAENIRRAETGEPLLHLVDRTRGY